MTVLIKPKTFALIGVLGIIGALFIPTSAQSAPPTDVTVFSNGNVVDDTPTYGEYNRISAAIAAKGFTVTAFDGGDGTAATWTTALNAADVFVLPEQERGPFYDEVTPPTWLSADAMTVLINWIKAGGIMLISGNCQYEQASTPYILESAIGVNYDNVMGNCDGSESTRYIGDSNLPASLPYADGTYSLELASFSADQLAPLRVWYSSDSCGGTLTVGDFVAGSGRIAFEAWDYYNDEYTDQDAWNDVLEALINDSSATSSWAPGGTPPTPTNETTASGEALYSVGTPVGCDRYSLYRAAPSSAVSAPIGDDYIANDPVAQGATSPLTGVTYVPAEETQLYTVNLKTGQFTDVSSFSADIDDLYEVYSLAFDSNGNAFAIAYGNESDDDFLGLFSLDVSNANLTLIAQLDSSKLEDSYAFAINPVDGKSYVIDKDSHELYELNRVSGALTDLGEVTGDSLYEDSNITAMQVTTDGVFYIAYTSPASGDPDSDEDYWVSMLASFNQSAISGGGVEVTEHGILTDAPLSTFSLLLGSAELAATGLNEAQFLAGFGATSAFIAGGFGLMLLRRKMKRAV